MAKRKHWWLVVRRRGDCGFCSAWRTRAKARVHRNGILPAVNYKVIKVVEAGTEVKVVYVPYDRDRCE